MYEAHFGLAERPFSIAPDPRYVYLSQAHEDALAHLLYGVGEGGGFVQLTGEVGTGKTTLIRSLVEQLPENVTLALIFNPRLSPKELVATVCDELHIARPAQASSLKELIDRLNARLLESYAAGRRTVLIIDEAQALSTEVLEQIRLLTNLETTREKLLQVVLVGQPELRDTLERPELRQLAQRITARYHMEPLSLDDTRNYLMHRLTVAGANRPLFSDGAVRQLHASAGGIPRLINVIADRALLGAYAQGAERVQNGMVKQAAEQVRGHGGRGTSRLWDGRWLTAASGALVLALGLSAGWWLRGPGETIQASASPVLMAAGVAREPVQSQPQDPESSPLQPAARESAESEQPVPAGPPAAQPPATDSFSEWLRTSGALTDTATALTGLFRAWGIEYKADGRPACIQAREQGLRCLLDKGNWPVVEHLDRPAVIELEDRQGEPHQLAILALGSEQVRVALDGRSLSFPRRELDPGWLGNFLMLWAPPESLGNRLIRPGDQGPAVVWLRERLAEVNEAEVVSQGDATVYDPALVDAVRRFQARQGLAQDGIVGPRTLIQINTEAPSVRGPRLRGREG
jgi:general secretion pathway protein A